MTAMVSRCSFCNAVCNDVFFKCPDPCGVIYCSKACQKKAWKNGHKHECGSRPIRYPMQQVVDDATVMVCRTALVYDVTPPEENILACVSLDTLRTEHATYQSQIAKGDEACNDLIDAMVQRDIILPGGNNERTLREHFVNPSRRDLICVVLRIRSLQSGDQCFDTLGQDPNDKCFIILKPNTGSPPAIGTTRVALRSYDEILRSELMIRHMPLVLTGQRVSGSPIEAAMAEHDEQGGRVCAVCGEVSSHIVLSDCNHPICFDCGREWHLRHLNATATCPVCRAPWVHFDSIYSDSLNGALEPKFERIRCCWCGKIAQYRCKCQCFEYCSPECRQEHAVTHSQECIDPWFLPKEMRLRRGQYLKWVGNGFETIRRKPYHIGIEDTRDFETNPISPEEMWVLLIPVNGDPRVEKMSLDDLGVHWGTKVMDDEIHEDHPHRQDLLDRLEAGEYIEASKKDDYEAEDYEEWGAADIKNWAMQFVLYYPDELKSNEFHVPEYKNPHIRGLIGNALCERGFFHRDMSIWLHADFLGEDTGRVLEFGNHAFTRTHLERDAMDILMEGKTNSTSISADECQMMMARVTKEAARSVRKGEPIEKTIDRFRRKVTLDKAKKCARCGRTGCPLKVCGSCKKVHYCSPECQRLDWKSGHKSECAKK